MKEFVLASVAALTLASGAQAQNQALLAQIRAACAIGGGNCVAAVQSLRASAAFNALSSAQKTALVGAVVTEVREVGAETEVVAVDIDVADALEELAEVVEEEGDAELAETIQEVAQEIQSGGSEEEIPEIPVGSFSAT